jgi:hypothetical protein
MLLRFHSLSLGYVRWIERAVPVMSHFGQPKVENLGCPARGHKDVRRLDVAVHDALGVRCIQCLGYIDCDREQLFHLQWPIADQMFQGLALQVLHDNEGLVAVFPDVINGADVGMIQGGRSLGLAPEASESRGVTRDVFRKKLQGYKTVEARVLGLVDHTHPATAELLNHPVVRDVLADHFAHGEVALQHPASEFG